MLLSIITPVYNAASFLPATIESILNQSFKDFELLLIDDGSTDGSAEICDAFAQKDNRVKVYHQANSGVSVARNKGIELAKGDFIGFIDSDDLIEQDMYGQLVSILIENDADIAQCNHDRLDLKALAYDVNTPSKVECISGPEFVKKIFTKKGREYTNQVALWSKIYKKHLLNDIHFPDGQTFEDEHETYKACFFAHKIVITETILYHYIKRENSIITGVSPTKLIDKQKALFDRTIWLPSRLPELDKNCYDSFINYSKYILCQLWISGNKVEFDKALKIMLFAMQGKEKYLNKYDKIYTYCLRKGLFRSLIMNNDFTPIQNWLKRIK